MNAIKHGLFANQTLSGLSAADAKKYTALLRGLVARYQPSDLVEELLVQKMAQGIWGEHRVQRWDLFVVERLAASMAQGSVSTIIIPHDAERLAEYGARFHACWFKAMRELERLRDERLSRGQQGSLQTDESEGKTGSLQ